MLLVLASLGAPASAQEWSPWRIIGPFEHPTAASLEDRTTLVDRQIADMAPGGKGPDLDQILKGSGGARLRWVPLLGAQAELTDLDVGPIDLVATQVPPPRVEAWSTNAVAYLHRTVEAPEALDVPVNVGSDDGLKLWLNGRLIVDRRIMRALNVQDHSLTFELRPGTNHLVAQVTNVGGGWSFQMKPWVRVEQDAIDEAIARAVRYLLDEQLIDGSWGYREDWGAGHAAFTAYVLMKSGLRADHPAIRMALEFARQRPAEWTYSLSSVVLALAEAGREEDREWLEDAVDRLQDWQAANGLYGYPVYTDGTGRPDDLSLALYAALAFRAAHKLEVDVPAKVWVDLARGALVCQERVRTVEGLDGRQQVGGFSYRQGGNATGSMTTAGVGILAMAREAAGNRFSAKLRNQADAATEAALVWIERHMTWTENPGQGAGHHFYFVYGIERVGNLLSLPRVGGVEWYWDGAGYLLRTQKENGSWKPEQELMDTQLALLFLSRSTLPRSGSSNASLDRYATATPEPPEEGTAEGKAGEEVPAEPEVRLRAQGDTPLVVYVDGFAKARSDELEWPGDVGDGPRIERVDFLARPLGTEPAAETVVGTAQGDVGRPAAAQRLAARFELPRRGRWLVRARVTALRPPAAEGIHPEPVELFSPDLEVVIDELVEPIRLTYAGHLDRNLFFDRRLEATASSSESGGTGPERAFDGSHQNAWRFAASDAEPWLTVRLAKSVRADRLRFSHSNARARQALEPRVARVAIIYDEKEPPLEADLDLDVMLETQVLLPGPMSVRELTVRVLSVTGGELGAVAAGFGELELDLGD